MAKSFFFTPRQLVVPAAEAEKNLPRRAAAAIGCAEEDILSCRVMRRSVDARKRRGKAVMVYHLRLEMKNLWRKPLRKSPHLDVIFEPRHLNSDFSLDPRPAAGSPRPVVVGGGPAGLFAALRLARAGWKPILIERGDPVDKRRGIVADFWRNGFLDTDSNILFGFGGAGLFSDGKLNTRHKDREGLRAILEILVHAGAPESVLVDAEPHVGSDLLAEVVERIGDEIVRAGGEIRFRNRLETIRTKNGTLCGVDIDDNGVGRHLATRHCILAIGHSARDVYEMLAHAGVPLESKPFAIGVRVEMPQEAIDASQQPYRRRSGGGATAPACSFRMSTPPAGPGGRPCYTFCMCPGGLVIPCASEPERLAVNGMSYHARSGEWGNAAFLVPVTMADFLKTPGLPPGLPEALAGVAFQRHWESKVYSAGLRDGHYVVPASRLVDFAAGETGDIPAGRSVDAAVAADLRDVLPDEIAATLAGAIPAMIARLKAVRPEDALLYAIESRTSSPVRITRGDSGESPRVAGLFPAGEGSGYAGGIMTSALDGWNAAAKAMSALVRP